MEALPQEICQAWENRNGAIILTTVDQNRKPNSIYATCAGLYKNKQIVVADNFFAKTRKNILAGSSGSVLFMTTDNKAYQVKGTLEYHKDGELFDFMKSFNPQKHPGHAAAVLNCEEVFSGAKQVC